MTASPRREPSGLCHLVDRAAVSGRLRRRVTDGRSGRSPSHKPGSVRPGDDDPAMAQNFIECDREQAFLMPPWLREWLPEDHLAWFVIEAVEEMDLAELTPTTAQTATAAPPM